MTKRGSLNDNAISADCVDQKYLGLKEFTEGN